MFKKTKKGPVIKWNSHQGNGISKSVLNGLKHFIIVITKFLIVFFWNFKNPQKGTKFMASFLTLICLSWSWVIRQFSFMISTNLVACLSWFKVIRQFFSFLFKKSIKKCFSSVLNIYAAFKCNVSLLYRYLILIYRRSYMGKCVRHNKSNSPRDDDHFFLTPAVKGSIIWYFY